MSLLVLGLLLYVLPSEEMLAVLGRVSTAQWLLILLAMFGLHVVTAANWRIFLRVSGVRCGLLGAVRAHGAGLFANLFLPGLVATDVVRAAMLARSGAAVAPLAVGSIASRLADTGALVTLASVGAAIAPGGGAHWATPAIISALLVLGSLVAPPLLRRLQAEWLPERVRATAGKLAEALSLLLSRPWTAAAAFALAVVLQASFVLLAMLLGRSLGIDVPVAVWFLAWPLAKLTLMMPITVGGLGVREAALAALLLPFAVDPAVAVIQGLVWQSLQISLALLAGATSYGSRRFLPTTIAHQGKTT